MKAKHRGHSSILFLQKIALAVCSIVALWGCSTNKTFSQENDIRLSAPIPQYSSTLFEDSFCLSFAPGYPNSHIHFTTDGNMPSRKSAIFTGKQCFTQSIHLKAISFHPHLQASEMVEIDFLQVKRLEKVKAISLLQEPSDSYPGGGASSLFDLQKGSLNFREKAWMGFDEKVVEIQLEFEKPQKLSQLSLSTLQDHGSWIFLPEKMEVISQDGSVLSQWPIPQLAEAKRLAYLHVSLDEIETQSLRIRITNADVIPDWHPGAGHRPWLFIDEVILK